MSNNKQSSIEWLVEMTSKLGYVSVDIVEQAKAMHKQEIIDVYNKSFELRDKPYSTALKYYNETFGDNNMGENNGEITTVNNIPDTNPNEGNTSTTGNISNMWGGDTSSTTGNINTWTETRTDDDNRIAMEKKLWDKTVNWDKNNTVNDEEQAPYNVKTNVVTSGKTDDGTLAVIEITIDIKQR